MSLSAVFVTPTPPHYADGPHISSNTGWLEFCDYVLARGDQYPALEHLADNVLSEEQVPGSFTYLRDDLTRLQADAGAPPDVVGVAASLLAALDEMPAGSTGFYVSDGEPNEDLEDDESESMVS